jgi:tubulin--tyrosine ligase-like protein 12
MVKVQGAEEFVRVHGLLLASAGVPSSLYERLFYKLSTDLFDAGSFFRIEPCEDEEEEQGARQRRLLLSSPQGMRPHQDVFLIDHAWSFRLSQARIQVQCNSQPYHMQL